jgi:hypothetical protein
MRGSYSLEFAQEMHRNSQFLTSSLWHELRPLRQEELKQLTIFNCMIATKLAQNLSQEQAAFATLLANYRGYKCVLSPRATPTLTQSGLLAVLLQRQRYKVIQLTRHRAHREKMRAAFWRTLAWLFHARTVRTFADDTTKPLIGTVPRHT